MKRKIFVVSGLGADFRMFDRLSFQGFDLVHIIWVEPSKGDSLREYAKKLLPQITEDNPLVMGLSLGGMIALEIGNLIQVKGVISLSSIVSKNELPFHYKLAGHLRLHKFIPLHWFAKGYFVTNWLFGANKKETKALLKSTLEETNPYFLKWATEAILNWDNETVNSNLYRIHGTKDFILPANAKGDYVDLVDGGGHLMVLEQYKEVQILIEKLAKSI